MTESEHLIAETLRLDAAVVSTHAKLESHETHSPSWWKTHEDWCEIRDERDGHAARSAPRLARMLKEAMDTLTAIQYASGDDGTIARALAEIEKIARGE